ncbi:MAG: hypothetical protein VW644_02060 [Alphaproteobacteria bacterium]|jgi:hypothetical protein
MANISVWIFDTEQEARDHAEASGGAFVGPVNLGAVSVTDRSGGGKKSDFFKPYDGKWGGAIAG